MTDVFSPAPNGETIHRHILLMKRIIRNLYFCEETWGGKKELSFLNDALGPDYDELLFTFFHDDPKLRFTESEQGFLDRIDQERTNLQDS